MVVELLLNVKNYLVTTSRHENTAHICADAHISSSSKIEKIIFKETSINDVFIREAKYTI